MTRVTAKSIRARAANLKGADEARGLAIDWQHWQAERSMSYLESMRWSCLFEEIAERPFFAAALLMAACNLTGYTAIAWCWVWATAFLIPFAAFWVVAILAVILSALNR